MENKKIIGNKGYTLEVYSWENDGDNYRTRHFLTKSKNEALAVKRLCDNVFKAHHDCEFGISNDCDATIEKYRDRIIKFMSNDEYFKSFDELTEMVEYVKTVAGRTMGYSEYYNCRVCESCEITFLKEDVYAEIIK